LFKAEQNLEATKTSQLFSLKTVVDATSRVKGFREGLKVSEEVIKELWPTEPK